MPELPEVEVVRRGLTDWVVGRRIEHIEVHDPRSVRRQVGGPDAFISAATSMTITAAVRRGKFLWLTLAPDSASEGSVQPAMAVMAHLGMSGQMLVEDAEQPWEKHLKVRLVLSERDGAPAELRFIDQRIFGGMWISELIPTPDAGPGGVGSHAHVIPEAAHHIGRDVLDPLTNARALRKQWRNKRTGIKNALMDQSVVSGVGNIYADEALWRVKRHYETPVSRLPLAEIEALLEALRAVMLSALEAGGTSFDSLYVNVNGASGYFDRSLNAYGRAGQPCPRCANNGKPGMIVREPWGGRSSFRCSWCQRRPRGL